MRKATKNNIPFKTYILELKEVDTNDFSKIKEKLVALAFSDKDFKYILDTNKDENKAYKNICKSLSNYFRDQLEYSPITKLKWLKSLKGE